MPQQQPHPVSTRSEEERARERVARERFQAERPSLQQLIDSGDADPPIRLGVYTEFRLLLRALKEAREAAGLSLADVAARSGIDKAALSRLENGVSDNPTVLTLMRYAAALGKRLTWSLEDLPADAKAVGR
jgi:DNA-binding XRE family transcriptional regulator